MTSFFPDLNVWLALSVAAHGHNRAAWSWLNEVDNAVKLMFCRYTQLGLLRLLTNASVMGENTLTIRRALSVYDKWLQDPRVEFHPEPHSIEADFRRAMLPFQSKAATKSIGDCYLLAYARACGATLVTFDEALYSLARTQGANATLPVPK